MALLTRALVIAFGALTVLVGFGWRDLEGNWGAQWDYPYEVIETVDKKAETHGVYRSGPGGVPVETIFEGTEAEYQAFAAEHQVGEDMLWPNFVIGAGVVVIVLGVAGVRRAPRPKGAPDAQ
jgi:hypothetical protein